MVIDQQFTSFVKTVRGAVENGGTSDAATLAFHFFEGFLGYIESEPDGFTVMLRSSSIHSVSGGLESLASELGDLIRGRLGTMVNGFDRDQLTLELHSEVLVAMAFRAGVHWLEDRSIPQEKITNAVMDLLKPGLLSLYR